MDSGFYILHPRFYTELGCAMTLLDFIYVYIYVYIRASFYRCPFFDNRFIVKVAPDSARPLTETESLSVSQFHYSEFFFQRQKFSKIFILPIARAKIRFLVMGEVEKDS